MLKKISLFLCFSFAMAWLFSQTAGIHILLPGKGQAWTDSGLEEIQKYYADKSAYKLHCLDGDTINWETYSMDAYDIRLQNPLMGPLLHRLPPLPFSLSYCLSG